MISALMRSKNCFAPPGNPTTSTSSARPHDARARALSEVIEVAQRWLRPALASALRLTEGEGDAFVHLRPVVQADDSTPALAAVSRSDFQASSCAQQLPFAMDLTGLRWV
jgi:hypothetical protein